MVLWDAMSRKGISSKRWRAEGRRPAAAQKCRSALAAGPNRVPRRRSCAWSARAAGMWWRAERGGEGEEREGREAEVEETGSGTAQCVVTDVFGYSGISISLRVWLKRIP
jgi:hypothetical protein